MNLRGLHKIIYTLNGGYIIPYKGGSIKIPVNVEHFPYELFLHLEQKCNICLPNHDINHRVQISHLGWACGTLGGIIMFTTSIITSSIAFLFEGIFTWEQAIFDFFVNPLLLVTGSLILVSSLCRLFLLPSTISAYRDYKLIKVSIIPIFVEILLVVLIIAGYLRFGPTDL